MKLLRIFEVAIIGILITVGLGRLISIFVYRTDYPEICEYLKSFKKAKNEKFEEIRREIFLEFNDATVEEIYDLETKLNIEIEEINKINSIYSMLTLFTFIIGLFWSKGSVLESINQILVSESLDIIYVIYIFWPVILINMFLVLFSKSTKHLKYYVFIKELIKRYRETNIYKKKVE